MGGLVTWDIRDPAHPVQLANLYFRPSPNAIAVSPQDHTLARDHAGKLALYYVANPAKPTQVSAVAGGVFPGLSYREDGRVLASISLSFNPHVKATARLWDVNDPHAPQLLSIVTTDTDAQGLQAVSFGMRGRTLAIAHRSGKVALGIGDRSLL